MPLPAILLGLAQLAPSILGLFSSNETASKAASVVSEVAKAVTGKPTDDAALEALKADPKLLIEYQQAVTARAVALYQEETKRLEAVNSTMKAEYASGDKYVARWRPTFGYVACFTWALQGSIVFGVLGYLAIAEPDRLARTILAMKDLMQVMAEHWLYAMAVLGIAVWKRSDDKKEAKGESGGILSGLFGKK
jgi:hypothetical protein